jgi:AcrR family transcriptional regulator
MAAAGHPICRDYGYPCAVIIRHTSMKKKARPRSAARPRRTNVERTAETRGKLIATTIDLLASKGYAATTTMLIAERAAVSRGAMLHHFPKRTDLLLAAAEFVVEEQRKFRRERIDQAADGLERVRIAGEVTWDVQQQPGTVALLELMLATRSDTELKRGLAPFIKHFREGRRRSVELLADNMKTTNFAAIEDMTRLHQAALRGLAIELMFLEESGPTERARRLLARYERAFMTSLGVSRPKGGTPDRKAG